MKKIKINFVGYEPYMAEHNFILEILKKYYEVEISEKPSILFYSLFNADFTKFNCVKVYVGGEPCIPDFNQCDYAISSTKIECGDRHCYYPFYFMDGLKNGLSLEKSSKKFKFCNFIYSHSASRSGLLRNDFCKSLMKYKMVDCLGKVMHNKDDKRLGSRANSNWRKLKQEVLQEYKFTIAFENAVISGYTTEKILDPLQVNSVPIYYGNPDIADLVNPEAFINANDYEGKFDELVEKVKEIDENDNLYQKMISCPKYNETLYEEYEHKLERFLINVVENGFVHDKDPYQFLDKVRISGYPIKKIFVFKILPYAARYYYRAKKMVFRLLGDEKDGG